ncbi:MAG: CPBP family intramembrane metalloprotease [Clostridia bacterium]|nr:CPBP family intramembrane metalloprotease [Clostridia bacterium]
MTAEEKNKTNASPSNARARRIRDAFPTDDVQAEPHRQKQSFRIQSDRPIEEMTFDGSDFFSEQAFEIVSPKKAPARSFENATKPASASEEASEPLPLAVESPVSLKKEAVVNDAAQVNASPTEQAQMQEENVQSEEEASADALDVEVVQVARELPPKKSKEKKKKPEKEEHTERIITVRPRAHRASRDRAESVAFKDRPFVQKTVAFAREYKKELPHNYLLFTPFLPLGICVLLVFFRIFYAIAAPQTGANIYACVAIINVMAFVPLCTVYLRKRPLLADRMGWKFPPADQLPLIFIAALALFFGAAALTSLGAYFGITEFRYHLYTFYDIPATTSIAGILFSTVSLAIIPALTEEILCRGIIFAEYQYDNTPLALIMSAIFSAVLQFDPSRLLVGLFCGFLLGTVRMVTNSLSASIAVHVLYNVGCLFYEHFFGIMGDQLSEFLILFFLCAVFALISFFFLFSTAEKVCHTYAEEQKEITVDLRSSSGVALKDSLKVAFISPTLYFVLIFYAVSSFFIS